MVVKYKALTNFQEESKRKDERIEQMMAFIKQVKQYANPEV